MHSIMDRTMTRSNATQYLRKLLDENGLNHWHIRLTMDVTKPFLGLCSYKDKTIILNAHHIDTHPDLEVLNTIRHEVAHALCPNEGHNSIWASKARELGCDNTLPCAHYGLSNEAIDAIHSGADLSVTFEEQVIRTPKYVISKLQDKCPTCGKVAKEKSRQYIKSEGVRKLVVTLECLHWVIKEADSQSDFESLVFDDDPNCKHVWGTGKYYSFCTKCTGRRLYPFQCDGARALERANGRFALFDDMGLGKTIQALAYLRFNKQALPYLWVTKSGVKYQHFKEILRVLGYANGVPQIIITGTQPFIKGAFPGYICSYDIFRRRDLDEIIDLGIQTLILDECQAIKNPDSTRTQCIRKIAKTIPRIIPMSGTFWKNRGSEAFVALNMLNPTKFHSFEGFKRTQVQYYWQGLKQKEGGLKPGFIDSITDIAIRRERRTVLPDMPLVNRTKLICSIDENVRHVYDEEVGKIKKIYNQLVLDGREDSNSFQTNADVMKSLMVMRQIIGIAKVPVTVEYAQDFMEETDRKLPIFVHHKQCGIMIYDQLTTWCKENGYPLPLKLTADMSGVERSEVQDKFNSKDYRILVASTLASGEGLNLQTASDLVLHERQWNPANEEQVEGRLLRIGQESDSINCIYVHADDTIDTDLDGIVEPKRVMFHNSMNRGKMETWNEGQILSELIKKVCANRKK